MLQPDFSEFPELVTSRLILRKLSLRDAANIFQMRSNELVMQYIDKERATHLADAETFIKRLLLSLRCNDGITWAIALKDSPASLIGTNGYWRLIKEHHRAGIGYRLDPSFWKKGIMKEALTAVIDMVFSWLKLHSIEVISIRTILLPAASFLVQVL